MNDNYRESTHLKQCRHHMFRVTSITPVYNDAEKSKKKRDIEHTLYEIFSKQQRKKS